jgi:manganese transport protein
LPKNKNKLYNSVIVPTTGSRWRRCFSFFGPGMMIAVGYMDPGNWATDIAGGSKFGYLLLSVILISNLFAMMLQHLALKLGIATGLDLAQACKLYFDKRLNIVLWMLCEIAIIATDLAEVIGSAIALNLLFGIPLYIGIILTAADVLVLLILQDKNYRLLEVIVITLIMIILGCFVSELIMSQPSPMGILDGLIPRIEILKNSEMLYIAIGIMGATVMPHNLYLHSGIIKSRVIENTSVAKKDAIKIATIDSNVSLFIAFIINASILILAASVFHQVGRTNITDIKDAYLLLDPILGAKVAGILFAVALLASGQNSTITGTMAGQIVMEGFLDLKVKPWIRRLVTRLLAIVPALCIVYYYGETKTVDMLVLSQVVLSIQLSFAVVPLVYFTSNRVIMREFVNPQWVKISATIISAIIIILNLWLLVGIVF